MVYHLQNELYISFKAGEEVKQAENGKSQNIQHTALDGEVYQAIDKLSTPFGFIRGYGLYRRAS